jgi:hypothetical protein
MRGKFVRPVSKTIFSILLGLLQLSPALAQPVSLSDLEGSTIQAEVDREQKIRREGNLRSVRIHQGWRIVIRPDKLIENTVDTTADTPRGTRKARQNSGMFTLEEPRPVASRGGGEAVWKFANGTLTFIRTFPSGAYRVHFAFARTSSGLTCTVTEAFARQDGRGEIKLQSAFGDGEVTIVSAKQLASSCKVEKKG